MPYNLAKLWAQTKWVVVRQRIEVCRLS